MLMFWAPFLHSVWEILEVCVLKRLLNFFVCIALCGLINSHGPMIIELVVVNVTISFAGMIVLADSRYVYKYKV